MVEPLSRPLLEEQSVLAGRFRLTRPLGDGPGASWLAHDDVLDRAVAVIAVPAREARARELLEEAGRAGAVTHVGLARIYDAAEESRPPRPRVAYVVREWIDGQRLPQLLHEGPLRPARAIELAIQAAAALVALHASGTGHGRLHPGNVVVDPAGRLHLTDAGISAVRADVDVDEAGDVRDAGALLYAMTTGRWPAAATSQPAAGLAAAPTDDRGVLAPRLVRAGVPDALSTVITRVLGPGRRPDQPAVPTAAALLRALEQVAAQVGREERAALPPEPRPPARWRRLVPHAGVLVGLVLLATCSYDLGQQVGEVQGDGDTVASIEQDIQASARPGGPRERRVDLGTAAAVRDFDPYGAGGTENPGAVPNAFDSEPSTAWETELYRTNRFGGLKPGVGLLLDLRTPTPLSRVVLDLTRRGAVLELRAGNTLGETEAGLPVVARGTASANGLRVQLRPERVTRYRYYLLWVTQLPEDGSQFRAGVTEMVALRQ